MVRQAASNWGVLQRAKQEITDGQKDEHQDEIDEGTFGPDLKSSLGIKLAKPVDDASHDKAPDDSKFCDCNQRVGRISPCSKDAKEKHSRQERLPIALQRGQRHSPTRISYLRLEEGD